MAPSSHLEDCFVGTVTVGERGQIVIPADARKKLGIGTGDRLFVMTHPSGEGLMVYKIDAMREFISHLAMNLNMVDGTEANAADDESNDVSVKEE